MIVLEVVVAVIVCFVTCYCYLKFVSAERVSALEGEVAQLRGRELRSVDNSTKLNDDIVKAIHQAVAERLDSSSSVEATRVTVLKLLEEVEAERKHHTHSNDGTDERLIDPLVSDTLRTYCLKEVDARISEAVDAMERRLKKSVTEELPTLTSAFVCLTDLDRRIEEVRSQTESIATAAAHAAAAEIVRQELASRSSTGDSLIAQQALEAVREAKEKTEEERAATKRQLEKLKGESVRRVSAVETYLKEKLARLEGEVENREKTVAATLSGIRSSMSGLSNAVSGLIDVMDTPSQNLSAVESIQQQIHDTDQLIASSQQAVIRSRSATLEEDERVDVTGELSRLQLEKRAAERAIWSDVSDGEPELTFDDDSADDSDIEDEHLRLFLDSKANRKSLKPHSRLSTSLQITSPISQLTTETDRADRSTDQGKQRRSSISEGLNGLPVIRTEDVDQGTFRTLSETSATSTSHDSAVEGERKAEEREDDSEGPDEPVKLRPRAMVMKGNQLTVSKGNHTGWRRRTPSARLSPMVIGTKFAELEEPPQGQILSVGSYRSKENTGTTDKRKSFLRTNHRSARFDRQQLKADIAQLADQPPKPTPKDRLRHLLCEEPRRDSHVGLNQVGLVLDTSLSSKLMSSIRISLPYGGETTVQCFQDSPVTEILDMLWSKLKAGITQCTELPASAQDFVDVVNMLLEENLLLAEALHASAELGTKDAVLQQLVDLMHMNDGFKYIRAAIDKELLLFHENEHSLFRGNSFATVLISAYMRHHGKEYLTGTLAPVLRNVIDSNRQLSSAAVSSSSPRKAGLSSDNSTVDRPQPILAEDTIILTVSEILDAIDRSILSCPGPIKSLCRYTSEAVKKKFPGNELRIVAGFIFLRFFCPALVKVSTLLGGRPVDAQVSRGMIQVTKLLQLIVNTAGQQPEEAAAALFHRYDQSQLMPLREKATRVLEALSNIYRGVPEKAVVSSGTRTRELVNSLFKVLIQRLTAVLKSLNEMSSLELFEEQATAIIGRLTSMLGYPLASKKDYCLKVAGTDYYLPTGGFRPLIDNMGLQVYFKQSSKTCSTERGSSRDFTDIQDGSTSSTLPVPAFSLVEKSTNKVEKRIALQIGCLVNDSHLPSWHFEIPEVNDFRCKLIHRIQDQDVLLIQPARILTGLCLDIMPESMVIKIHLSQDHTSKTMEVSPMITASMLMEQVCSKVRHVRLDSTNLMFKVGGKEQYIIQDVVLGRLEYVSQCVKSGQRPMFTLVKKSLYPFEKLERSVLKPKCLQIALDPTVDDQSPRSRASSTAISVSELPLESSFTIAIEELFDVDFGDLDVCVGTVFFVVAGIYHGGVLISREAETARNLVPEWNESLDMGIFVISLPREARLCLTLYGLNKKNGWRMPIGWVSFRLFDFEGHLITGKKAASLWPKGPANPIGSCCTNPSPAAPNALVVHFPIFDVDHSPVVFSDIVPLQDSSTDPPPPLSEKDELCLEYLLTADQLYPLSITEKELLWKCRESVADKPYALPKLLQAVDWADRACIAEMYRLLALWAPVSPHQALMLLDAKFEDQRVRRYAAKVLGRLEDDELEDFLLQLVQVLKHEPYHYSALAKFLIGRALRSPQQIGQKLFWLLFAELRSEEAQQRYSLMLEAYLRGCGSQRENLLQQIDFVHKATDLSLAAREKSKSFSLTQELHRASLPTTFALPYDSTVIASDLVPDECKVMDSFQRPLMLSFLNKDHFAEHLRILVKTGDDLRQDVLTLQMFRIMQKLWIGEGLDLRMSAYHCMSTGPNVGLIEIVNDATTTAGIQSKAAGVRGAFIEQTLYKWLSERNPSEPEMSRARENFIRSCAGYCIATFVLGIGDRHNDNIMLTSNGHLFHIDFGHFLGNVQKWKGFKRDRSPFVLTPEFAYVMGGKNSPGFDRFVDYCCRGYNILRKSSDLFITLFALMLSTGMPELKCKEDIEYLREAFSVEKSDEEAAALFKKLIFKALNTTATRLNNALHLAAQQLRNN